MSPTRTLALAAAAVLLGSVMPPSIRPALAAPTPTAVSIVPRQGPIAGGTTVTITGTNFFDPMVVFFGGLPATQVKVTAGSTTSLTCIAPGQPVNTVDVVVAPASDTMNSATLPAAFTYNALPSSYVWVPRGPGMAGGGPDVAIVDYNNRRETATLDLDALIPPALKALPGFPALPTDDLWCVTQVLFSSSGDTAFLATAGEPGAANSGLVYIVDVGRAVGDEGGSALLGVLPALNPYQLAFSSDGLTLVAADGGSWATATGTLADVPGFVLAWDLQDLADSLSGAVPESLPVPGLRSAGALPVLAHDRSSMNGWDSNSSFRGTLLTAPGLHEVSEDQSVTVDYTPVTSVFGNEVRTLGLPNLVGSFLQSRGIPGLPDLTTTSTTSPFESKVLFLETFQRGAAPAQARYFRDGITNDVRSSDRAVAQPIRFFDAPDPDLHDLPALRRLGNRTAWPYPGALAMVALPEGEPNVASWDAAGGEARLSDPLPGGLPTGLAYNDVTGFFYARHGDGGWTVLKVPPPTPLPPDECPNGTLPPENQAPALVVEDTIEDAMYTDIDSLRVVGNGSFLLGTGASRVVVIEGRKTALPADIHRVLGAPIPLTLDPAGGPLFTQPGSTGGTGRNFPLLAGRTTLKVTGPIIEALGQRVPFDLATLGSPPGFTGIAPDPADPRYMLELGSQYDFLPVKGSVRIRVPYDAGSSTYTPTPELWLQLLKGVGAGGDDERPLYARMIEVDDRGRVVDESPTVCFHFAAAAVPVLASPAFGAPLARGTDQAFAFDANVSGTATLVFRVLRSDLTYRTVRRVRVGDVADGATTFTVRARIWNRIAAAARRASATDEGVWTVEVKDAIGRVVPSAERVFTIP